MTNLTPQNETLIEIAWGEEHKRQLRDLVKVMLYRNSTESAYPDQLLDAVIETIIARLHLAGSLVSRPTVIEA